jgi:hypothetical protein
MGWFHHEQKWVAQWEGHQIIVTNWWDFLLRSGEFLTIDGRPIPQPRTGLVAATLRGDLDHDGRLHHVRAHIGHTWTLMIACHIFVDDHLVGGDLGKRLLV